MRSLRQGVEEYLEMRRALGFKLYAPGVNLRHFVSFMEREGASVLTTHLALSWAQSAPNVQPSLWAARLSYVRSFARYWSAIDPRTEVPPLGLLPYRTQRTTPYIYSDSEIRQLLQAALTLPPSRLALRPWTYYTLFGLLAVSGMRLGEVIRLERADVNLADGLLAVRWTKFNKSRLVPLHPSTVKALRRYSSRRDSLFPEPATDRFFLSNWGRALTDCTVRWTFVRLSGQIGLRTAGRWGSGPRLHDFRHRFAVTTLINWYRAGLDVEQRLPVLSTYLGHTHVADTYWYLSAIPELLALTKNRLEQRWENFS